VRCRRTRCVRGGIVTLGRICRENTTSDTLKLDRTGMDRESSENIFPHVETCISFMDIYEFLVNFFSDPLKDLET
jgi:hypothetical protein